MTDKEIVIVYLKSCVSILEQNASFPADMDIIDGYLTMMKISLEKYKLTIAKKKKG